MFALHNARLRRPQSRPSRRPLIEPLEHRALLSGNVLATQQGTNLNLDGDHYSNWVKVYSGYLPHEVVVVGENYTRVNGSYYPQHFYGIESVSAQMDSGDDSFKAINLCLTTIATGPILDVDGGRGDDFILVKESTLRAEGDPFVNFATVNLVGEIMTPASPPTTGNDCIQVYDTTILAKGGEQASPSLQIGGEVNQGGNVTCGNDNITVSNTRVLASDGVFGNGTSVIIVGDHNAAGGTFDDDNDPETPEVPITSSTIGVGNDTITVSYTDVKATGDLITAGNATFLQVFGDQNSAIGGTLLDPVSSTIGAGNDDITVSCTNVKAQGSGFENMTLLQVYGDDNSASGAGSTANICGGNDSVFLTGSTISASGATRNQVGVFSSLGTQAALPTEIVGDRNTVNTSGTATIGGGNDCISVCNTIFSATGDGALNDVAPEISGDKNIAPVNPGPFLARIEGGNDDISADDLCVNASGTLSSNASQLFIFGDGDNRGNFASEIGGGNDTIALTNSRIFSSGSPIQDKASLQILSDDALSTVISTVGEGNDCVSMLCVQIEGGVDPLSANLQFHTAKGCDFAEVRNSQWRLASISTGDEDDVADDDFWFTGNCFDTLVRLEMGAGSDDLWFIGNTFNSANVDGGVAFGHDRLVAHDNTAAIVATNWEEINGSPSLPAIVIPPG
jgi:hypothetical protein